MAEYYSGPLRAAASGKRCAYVSSAVDFLSVIVGVKWWVCREAPIFDSEAVTQNPSHLLLMPLFIPSIFVTARLECLVTSCH